MSSNDVSYLKRQAIIDEYLKGDYKTATIAKNFGVTRTTVSKIARRAGIPLRGQGTRKYSIKTLDKSDMELI